MGNNSKKILILLGSSRYGGGEKHALDLVRHSQNEFDVTLGIPNDSVMIPELKQAKIPYIIINYPKYPWELFSFAQALKPYSLIHAHLNLACRSLTFLGPLAKPWLATIHGFSSVLPYLVAQKVICVSQALQSSLPIFLKRKSRLIYNGITDPGIVPSPQNKIKQAFVFATIHPNKGQELVVKSLPLWEKKLPELQITFVGTGSIKHENSLSARLPPHSQLQWIKKNQNLDLFWAQADFILIPSFYESLSYVALEAQARGIPIISSKTGGLLESTMEWGGIFFEPGNPNSLAEALVQMVDENEKLRTQLGQKPLLLTQPHFSLKRMLGSIHEEWSQML